MDVDKYDDKCPSWLTTRKVPPVQLWADHFLQPSKKRNVLYTRFLEERLAVCKVKYGFLQPDQVFGMALRDLGVPTCGYKINQNFLNMYKKNMGQSKSDSKLWNVNSRSFRLFEDADMSSIVDDNDSYLLIRAPSPLRAIRAPSPPRECFQHESIYDDLTEMFEDVEILPYKSLNRKTTRPSDICSNDNRKNIRCTKDNRLLNQFEIFKELSICELLPTSNRKEETEPNAVAIIEKSAITNKSILKTNSSKENINKKPNFEKSVQFGENLESIREYQPFEESESSTIEYSSPIDGNGERNFQDRSETFLNLSPIEACSIINEEHEDDDEIIFTELEDTPNNEETTPSESIGEVPASSASIEEEKDRVDKNKQIDPQPLNVNTDTIIENSINQFDQQPLNVATNSPTNNTNQYISKIESKIISSRCDVIGDVSLLIEKSQTEGFEIILPHSQNSLNESIICNSLDDSAQPASHILLKNKLKEKLDCGNLNTIQEDDIHKNSLQSNVASSKQDLDEFEDNSSIQDLYEETASEQSDIDPENDYLSNSITESDEDGEIVPLNVTLNKFGINEQDRSNIEVEQSEHSYSQNSDISSDVNVTDCNELEIPFQNVESQKIERKNLIYLEGSKIPIHPENKMMINEDSDVELLQEPRKRGQRSYESPRIPVRPDIDPENDYLSNSITESDEDGEIVPLNVTLNEFGINEQDRSNIEVEQSEHSYSQNSDISSDVNVTDCNELEIPFQNVESQKIERKNLIYLEGSKIPIHPENKMMINEDSDVELLQEPRKRGQRSYESPRIPVRPDIDPENDYLSNSITESDEDGEIVPLNVTLNKFGINEQDRSNIEVEQSEHSYSQNSDISSDVNVTDCNELEIPFQNVESQKIERKNLIYLEGSKIPIHPENKMMINEDSDVELLQEPRKRGQRSYESPRIPVHPANEINTENRDVGSPEDLFKGEQRHNYESTRIPIRPGNKIIKNISSYEETCGENNDSYFQTNNVKKQDHNLFNLLSTMDENKPSFFQSYSIPIRPENRKHLDKKMEGVNLPEGCHDKDQLSHFQSELIPIHPMNNDEHVSLSEEHIASQLFVKASQSPNEHFELNSSSSKSPNFDETVKKITRKRNFTSISGTPFFNNTNDYLTEKSEKNTPNYGIASPCSNDEGTSRQHSTGTNYDISLEEMMNWDNDEPCEIYSDPVKTIDRSCSFNIPSLDDDDDDYQMIKSDDSLAVLRKASKKDKQNLESNVGTKQQSQIKSDGESSTSSMELTTPPKKRKRSINTGSTTNILQSSPKKTVLTSQTTNITEGSSRLTDALRKDICTDWLAQNEFFNPNSDWHGMINPLTGFNRVSDPVLPVDNGGEEKFNKLPDIEFSSSEY